MIKRKITGILICFLFLSGLILPGKALFAEENNKKLELKQNHSHLFSFDEKIIRYRLGDDKAFEIEILPDIFKGRHEMIIKPLCEVNTNLIVWTRTRVYNFDLKIKNKRELTEFFSFINGKKGVLKDTGALPGEYELDMPPFLQKQNTVKDFEIDLPPQIR